MRSLMLLLLLAGATSTFAIPPFQYLPNLQVDELSAGAPVATLADNDAADFGRVFAPCQPGTQSAWLTIEVTSAISAFNAGDLYLTTPTITGSDFVLDTTGFSLLLAAGSSSTFKVAFAPQSGGSFSATLTFQWQEDPWGYPGVWTAFRINFAGSTSSGQVAHTAVHEGTPGGPRVYHNQPVVSGRAFGKRKLDAGPAPSLSLWIYNDAGYGAPDLHLGTPTFVSSANEFSVDLANFSPTLAAGAGTEIVVTFDPWYPGTYAGVLEFSQDDGLNANPFTLLFSGEGIAEAAQIRVCDNAGPFFSSFTNPPPAYIGTHLAENAAATGARDFGQVSSGSLTITVCNADVGYVSVWGYEPGADLALGTPTVVGDPDFTLNMTGYSNLLTTAGTTTFTINFTPQANGVRSAVIEIPHGDSTERAPFRIQVTGFGTNITGGTGGTGGGAGSGGGGCAVDVSGSTLWMLLAVLGGVVIATRLRRA
ncbi:MAG: choice-of-anchor D domain-containing protein [Planctomycetes bacterium]|nr:choice-of-anchor D domain-containing protein [Planctomycetota bacterium]